MNANFTQKMASNVTIPLLPVPPNIQVSAGPLLLGYMFNWGLYGALAVQVYMYYMSFPKDRLAIKALVFGLFTIETVQTVLATHDLFHAYAIGWGNLAQLESAQLEWLTVPIISGIVSCTVQLFFAYRISVLSGSNIIGCVIAAVAVTQGVSAITQGIQAAIINDIAKLQSEAFVSCTLWLAGSAACDVMIAVCMSYFLSRKDTGFKATQVLINKLVRLTIETGTLTATVATVDIILFLAFPHNNYHTAPALTLAKLYTNTLLLIFNSRMRVIGGRDGTQTTELLELRTTKLADSTLNNTPNVAVRFGTSRAQVTDISVRKEMWTDSDIPPQEEQAKAGDLSSLTSHNDNWSNV